jgi:threonine/homoserine/homoserine lactone efflux protein
MGTTFFWVRWISGIYLIFLGYQAITHKQEQITDISKQSGKSFLVGIFITFGNPKVIVFYLGFLPAFFDMNLIKCWGYLEIIGIIALVSILVLETYIKLADVLVKRVDGVRLHRLVSRIAGTIMVAAGVKVVSS